jgi:preprotein translocase subunit SecF
MIEIFKNTKYNFLGFRKKGFVISGILIMATIGSIIYHGGFNLAVDFVGGTLTIFRFEKPVQGDIEKIRDIVNSLGLGSPEVKTIGTFEKHELQITVRKKSEGSFVADQIKAALKKNYAENQFTLEKEERVGPKVSAELAQKALIAILLSWIAIIIYMAFRFKLPHGIAAVSGLIHDVIITTGVFTMRNAEISLSFVAAILTVIYYCGIRPGS